MGSNLAAYMRSQSLPGFIMAAAPERTLVVAVVLAAGSSARMGKPKLTLPVEGKPMLERVLGTLRKTRVAGVVVVLGAHAQTIRAETGFKGEKVVVNHRHHEGMSGSLKLGIESAGAEADAVMVVLADMPLLEPRTVDALIGAYETTRPKAVVPVCGGRRGNPVILDRSLFPTVMKLHGDVGAKSVVAASGGAVLEVPVDDSGVLYDVDDPEAYLSLLRQLSEDAT